MAQVRHSEQKRLLKKLKLNTVLVLANIVIVLAAVDFTRAYGS